MSNPLTKEQLEKINEISKLPADIQKEEFSKFLEELDEEQVEFLRQQQGKSQCLFCSISENKISSYKIYEDDNVLGILDINPASKGHVIVFPKMHFEFIGELNEELNAHMFNVVNKISSNIIGKFKADGVSIYVANGHGAGQSVPHICVHVIPRYKNDNLNFFWNSKKANADDLKKVSDGLRLGPIGVKTKETKKIKQKPRKLGRRIP